MEMNKGKVFEQPPAGMAVGTIIDVVDMPKVPVVWAGVSKLVNKVRLLWILNNLDNSPMLDKEGKPLTVAFIKPASMHPKSDLSKMLVMLLGGAPPLISKTEELSPLLLGRSNVLFITHTPKEGGTAGDFYANVTGAGPLTPGQIAPVAPKDFVRSKDQVKQVGGQATYATEAAAQQAQFAAWQAAQAPAPAASTPTAPPAPMPGAPVPPTNNRSF